MSELGALLRGLSPRLNDGSYVYTQIAAGAVICADPVVMVREAWITLLVPHERAQDAMRALDTLTSR